MSLKSKIFIALVVVSTGKAMQQSEICCICQDTMTKTDDLTWLPCMHRLHTTCHEELSKHDNKCPLCRAPFSPNTEVGEVIIVFDDIVTMPVGRIRRRTDTDCLELISTMTRNLALTIRAFLRRS